MSIAPFRKTNPALFHILVFPFVLQSIPASQPQELPKSVDLSPVFASFRLSPRAQGSRPTCSVFVITQALEFAAAQSTGKGRRLSVDYLNRASNDVLGKPRDGGNFSGLWKGFEKHGIAEEATMPYAERFDPARAPSDAARKSAHAIQSLGWRLHWIKEWDSRRGLNEAEFHNVRKTLASGQPVCGGFLWPKKQEWKEHVLQMCPRDAVRDGHSILLVGYCDDHASPGNGVFLIRNSSGPGRTGKLTYEYVKTYMNDAAWIECTTPKKKMIKVTAGTAVILIDATDTPDLEKWAREKLAPVVKTWYPKIAAMLPSKGYTPPQRVTITFSSTMRGVAATGGNRVRCAAQWYRRNLKGEALGSVVHELVHVVQQYRRSRGRSRRTPIWVVEGIADYIRWFKYEPETRGAEIGRRSLSRARYNASYRISANFINWVTETHNREIVKIINAEARAGRYTDELWKQHTGLSVQELDKEWRKHLTAQAEEGRKKS